MIFHGHYSCIEFTIGHFQLPIRQVAKYIIKKVVHSASNEDGEAAFGKYPHSLRPCSLAVLKRFVAISAQKMRKRDDKTMKQNYKKNAVCSLAAICIRNAGKERNFATNE